MSDGIHSQAEEVFRKGDMIFSEGDRGDYFYIIKEGSVDVFKINKGKKVPLGMVRKNQVLGEFSVIDGEPRSANALAMTDVVVQKISANVLQQQIAQNPEWFAALIQSLVARTRKMNDIFKRYIVKDPGE